MAHAFADFEISARKIYDLMDSRADGGQAFERDIASMTVLGRLRGGAGRRIRGAGIPVDGGMLVMLRPHPVCA